MKITCIDFETTGAVPGYPNEPWQLGMVDVVDGKVEASTKWETLFKVGDRPFSPRAPKEFSEKIGKKHRKRDHHGDCQLAEQKRLGAKDTAAEINK